MAASGEERRRLLRERRLTQRRQAMRRRRAAAVGALAVVVCAVVVAVAGAILGGSTDAEKKGRESAETTSTGAAKKPAAKSAAGIQISKAGWKPHPGPIPFLMYHVIGDPEPAAPFPDLYVPVADFKEQMAYLDSHGYQAVTQAQAQDGWDKGAPLPPKPIVLTFDDGYLGQFTDALPILRRHDWPGVLNLKVEGSDLNTGEVRKMIAAGWELASHTISHADLTTIDPVQLKREVEESRQILRRRFHVPVESFCYPAGRYDDTVVVAVRRAGYRGATTTDPGLASSEEPFTLKRIRIGRDLGLTGFAAALQSAGASSAAPGAAD